MDTILIEDVLATLHSKTAIIKIDVETLECKVNDVVDVVVFSKKT